MFFTLRVARGIFLVLLAMQVLLLLPALSWLQQPSAVTGNMLAMFSLKSILVIVLGALFVLLHKQANKFYFKKNGADHPAITKIMSF